MGYKHRKASPKPNRAILVRWLRNNIIRPNPTTQQISVLAEQADMTYVQVKNWFGNTRRTLKKKGPKGADEWLQRHDTHSADPSYMVAVKQFHGKLRFFPLRLIYYGCTIMFIHVSREMKEVQNKSKDLLPFFWL